MPKLNLIGMVVLCLAVAAGAAVMALKTGNVQPEKPRFDKLIRGLGDADPDLRREAERELKQLGAKAEPALKEAARGSDPAVAERARVLLGIKKVDLPPEGAGSQAAVPASEPAVRLTLQIASSPRRADEPVLYYLRIHNDTKRSLVIARRQRDGRLDYRDFGGFERIDAEGRVVELVAALPAPGDDESSTVEAVVIAPGDSVDLVPGTGLLRVGATGTFRIRYVYDAAEGSEYREWLATGHHAGAALPSERIVSNTAAVTIP